MAKTLLLMRHAKSSWKEEDLKDIDRPLNKRGKKDAPMMAKLLKKENLLPDLVLCSSAKRSRHTVRAMFEELDIPEDIVVELDSLYLAEPQAYLEAIHEQSENAHCILVVGHNPGLEALAQVLTDSVVSLPTATIAEIKLPIKKWSDLSEETKGTLQNVWKPKGLKKK